MSPTTLEPERRGLEYNVHGRTSALAATRVLELLVRADEALLSVITQSMPSTSPRLYQTTYSPVVTDLFQTHDFYSLQYLSLGYSHRVLVDMDHNTLIPYARLASGPLSLILAGFSLSFSQTTVPLIYDIRPQISTVVFKGVFYNGAAVIVPGTLISAASSSYLAYMMPEQRRLWITAAAAVLFTQAWTVGIMLSGINRLLSISEAESAVQAKVEQNLEHRQLLKAWVRQNYVRASSYLVGGMVGLYAAASS